MNLEVAKSHRLKPLLLALGGDCRWYWSSSRHSTHYHYARIVAFTGGGVHYDGCSYTHGVRCVR